MAALYRALAFEQVHHVAVGVGHHLDLDVPRPSSVRLDEERRVPERRERFAACGLDRCAKRGRVVHHAHPSSTTTRGGFHQHGEPDTSHLFFKIRRRMPGLARFDLDGGKHRDAGCGHHGLGRQLRPHRLDHVSRGTDEGETARYTRPCETGVLRQEPVARVHRVGAGSLRGVDQQIGAQVCIGRRRSRQPHHLVSSLCVRSTYIRLRAHRDTRDAGLLRASDHPQGDLTAIGDEQLLDHGDPVIGSHPEHAVTACSVDLGGVDDRQAHAEDGARVAWIDDAVVVEEAGQK